MQYCHKYKQLKHTQTIQTVSELLGSSLGVDLVADEMENAIQVDLKMQPIWQFENREEKGIAFIVEQ